MVEVRMWRGKRVHFVGIGGSGMSSLAKILLRMGAVVSGSDIAQGRNIARLARLGADIRIGHDESAVEGADLVVYSSAVPVDNPEVAAAHRLHIPTMKRGRLLAKLAEGKRLLAVAGTHGKTTTTAMVATVFVGAGLDPAYAMGGICVNLGDSGDWGDGEILVAEADESDGSFLWLDPAWSVVTNVDVDHLDFYQNRRSLISAFKRFIAQTSQAGAAVLCTDCETLRQLATSACVPVVRYGLLKGAAYGASDVQLEGLGSRFTLTRDGEGLCEVRLAVPGRHNVQNAVGALAACIEAGVAPGLAAEALAAFRGVRRRFEVKADLGDVKVVDDYAHHPAEIMSTLAAARAAGARRVLAVFQPHRFTRTQALARAFARAFEEADKVFVMDVYPAGERPIPGVSSQLVIDALRHPEPVTFCPSHEHAVETVAALLEPGDFVVTLGAGDVWRVANGLAVRLGATLAGEEALA